MGKVKDEVSGQKPAKAPAKGKSGGGQAGAVSQFFLNLFKSDLYKPKQGWRARVYTAVGLGVILAAGVWRLHEILFDESPAWRFGVPAAAAAILGWCIFRILHYPLFAEFLIATEAEMNKVSWTTKDDLYRSTVVVLVAVLVMSLYLFAVDWVWLFLLRNLGVLQFDGSGGFGSTS